MFSRRAYVAAAIAAQPLRVGEYSQIDYGRLDIGLLTTVDARITTGYQLWQRPGWPDCRAA